MLLEDITKHPSYQKLVKQLAKAVAEQNLQESSQYYDKNRNGFVSDGLRKIDYMYREGVYGIDEEMAKVAEDVRISARTQYREMVNQMFKGKM